MLLNNFTFHSPQSLKELTKLLPTVSHFRIQAGGTFLLNALKLQKKNNTKTPEHIISLHKIKELNHIDASKTQITIGSMTTIDDIFCSETIQNHMPILIKICRNISTQQIRNMATIGGNLTCRYTWTEMPAVAIALKAQLHFISPKGKESSCSAEEFFQDNAKTDNILTKITFPIISDRQYGYHRVKKSQFVDIPLLSVVISTTETNKKWNDTIVAINNCVEFAQRDSKLEDFLNQADIQPSIPEEALDRLTESIYDKRSDDYKRHMFRHAITETLTEILKKSS